MWEYDDYGDGSLEKGHERAGNESRLQARPVRPSGGGGKGFDTIHITT